MMCYQHWCLICYVSTELCISIKLFFTIIMYFRIGRALTYQASPNSSFMLLVRIMCWDRQVKSHLPSPSPFPRCTHSLFPQSCTFVFMSFLSLSPRLFCKDSPVLSHPQSSFCDSHRTPSFIHHPSIHPSMYPSSHPHRQLF